jgi:NADH:ubiquinone oxidoreductase subunit 4 (subunit M)
MVWGNLGYIFGCDYISYGLIFFRFWVCVLIITAGESVFRSFYYPGLFLCFVVLLMIILFCTFSRINLFSFYLFFESSLIPTVFLILGWGYQPERLQAGIYLLFNTLLPSLPMLAGIFYVYSVLNSTTGGLSSSTQLHKVSGSVKSRLLNVSRNEVATKPTSKYRGKVRQLVSSTEQLRN